MRRFTKYPSNYIKAASGSELALIQSDFWEFLGDCIDGVFDAVEQRKHIVDRDLDEKTRDIIIQCEDGTYYRLPFAEYSAAFQYAYDTYGEDYAQCVNALMGTVLPWTPTGNRLGSGKYRLGSDNTIRNNNIPRRLPSGNM